jgi:LacI family transcriptional regulator
MNRCATIKDVALLAGVGKGTVDRVIHDKGRVSEETKAKVLDAMKQLDYHPNTAAQMLRNKKHYRVGVVFHNYEKEFWGQVETGVDEAIDKYTPLGIEINKFILPKVDIPSQEQQIKALIEEQYDGIAIVPYSDVRITDAINEAVAKGIEVVTFNNDERCNRLAYVGQDLYQSGRTAGELMALMLRKGAHYVTMVPISKGMSKLETRLNGFNDALRQRRSDLIYLGNYDLKEDVNIAYSLTKKLVKKGDVDAIYVSNVLVADVAQAIADLQLDRHITLIGHDSTKAILKHIKDGTIDISLGQEPERQGFVAVDKLCKKLLTGENGNNDVYTKIEIVTKENMLYL